MEIIWKIVIGEGQGKNGGGMVQGIRSIIGRHKMDGGRLKII